MSRQAVVGLFTIIALVALFGIFFVLANYSTGGRYSIGVHFKSASGLHKGALVYESGVVVGTVQSTQLLPDDFSVEVVMQIDNKVDIPRDARFVIQAPLTGDSTVEIVPPSRPARPANYVGATPSPGAIAVLPHEILPLEQQPQGQNPTTIQDLLAQGQGQLRRLDQMLAELQQREPRLLATLQNALDNANAITMTMKRSVGTLSDRLDTMTTTLQTALGSGSANLVDVTAQLDQTVRGNRGHFDAMIASLDASARALNQTADSVRDLVGDERIRANLLRTSQGIADTATTVSSIAADLRKVSGNPQTQAQLRDTIANADAAMQKANSLLGSFGGTSSVYGVDAGATPAPAGTLPPATAPTGGAPRPSSGPKVPESVRARLNNLTKSLVAFDMRVTAISGGSTTANNSRYFPINSGPESDFNVSLLPENASSLYLGASDVGTRSTSYNFLPTATLGSRWRVGLGVLYSNLGMRAVYHPAPGAYRGLSIEERLYDLQHPTSDTYLNYGLSRNVEIFGGERDIFHSGRRTAFGVQVRYGP